MSVAFAGLSPPAKFSAQCKSELCERSCAFSISAEAHHRAASFRASVDSIPLRRLRCLPVSKPRRIFRLPHPEPLDALSYARFTGIPTFMRLPHIAQPEELDVALIGVPFDGGTTYRPGPRFGPRNVRV